MIRTGNVLADVEALQEYLRIVEDVSADEEMRRSLVVLLEEIV